MPTFLALSPLLVRALKLGLPILLGVLLLPLLVTTAVLNKSTLAWPVAAPTQVTAGAPAYAATGWTIARPFGWQLDPDTPGAWALHDGADLAGPLFCAGCPVPPLGDVTVAAVGWDQPGAPAPQHAGAGVVVDLRLQHPEEAGDVTIRYGHLQPYQVWVRTQTCTQTVDCPAYSDDALGRVTVDCPGGVTETATDDATHSYVYATPGACRASVDWPTELTPDGPTQVTFDQQIAPGESSRNAAITFRAQRPPPPTATPTPSPTATP